MTVLKNLCIAALVGLASTAVAHDGFDHPKAHATKALNKPVQTGTSEHSYTTVPGWGKIPGMDYIGSTHGGVRCRQSR